MVAVVIATIGGWVGAVSEEDGAVKGSEMQKKGGKERRGALG